MNASRTRPGRVVIKLACAGLLLAGAAQARHDACDAAPQRSSSACVTHVAAAEVRNAKPGTEALAAVSGVRSVAAAATLALWQGDRGADVAAMSEPLRAAQEDVDNKAVPSEPTLLGLLLAALGVVGFVAQRRGGG